MRCLHRKLEAHLPWFSACTVAMYEPLAADTVFVGVYPSCGACDDAIRCYACGDVVARTGGKQVVIASEVLWSAYTLRMHIMDDDLRQTIENTFKSYYNPTWDEIKALQQEVIWIMESKDLELLPVVTMPLGDEVPYGFRR
jgi:hypothetical protein